MLSGYVRCSTDQQYFTAPRQGPDAAAVNFDRIYVEHGAAGVVRAGPELAPSQEAHLVRLRRAGRRTSTEFANLFGLARSTTYRPTRRAGSTPDMMGATR